MRWEFPTKKTHTPSIFLRGWFLWHFSCYHSFIPLSRLYILQCEDKISIFGFCIQVTIDRLWTEWASNHTPNFYICLYLTYQQWMKSNAWMFSYLLIFLNPAISTTKQDLGTVFLKFLSFCLFIHVPNKAHWVMNKPSLTVKTSFF